MELSKLEELFSDFKQLPKTLQESEPTFFEVAGYPNLENVASNFLAFFLDPFQPHQLDALFLESLLSSVGYEFQENDFSNVEVEREAVTDSRYRIDIVIQTEGVIVGIENKLFAALNNDLHDYYNFLKKRAGKRKIVAILLTLFPLKADTDSGFISITYEDFFKLLVNRIENKQLNANDRYYILLIDFMNTMKNLKGNRNMENLEFVKWFGENQEDIEVFLYQVEELKKEIINKAKGLGCRIQLESLNLNTIKYDQWIYHAYRYRGGRFSVALVFDIELSNAITVAIDTVISPSKIEILIFNRKGNLEVLAAWLEQQNIPVIGKRGQKLMYGKKFSYCEDSEAQKTLQELIDILSNAIVREKTGNNQI